MSNASIPARLDGRVALVTAGDTPAGRSLAAALAAAGADVAVTYHNDHAAAAEARRAVTEKGRSCLILPADLSLERECGRIVGRTVYRFGTLDLLALVPSARPAGETILDVEPGELEWLVRTPLLLTRAALPYLNYAVLVTESAFACLPWTLAQVLEKRGVAVTVLDLQGLQP